MKTLLLAAFAAAISLSGQANADMLNPENRENCTQALREHFRDDASRTVRTDLTRAFGLQMQDLQAQLANSAQLIAAVDDAVLPQGWKHADY